MRFDVITLFPEIIQNYCSASVIGRAFKQEVVSVNTINPRDFSTDKHKKVDDTPYGGGAGMVLMCPPFFDAYESVKKLKNSVSIIFTPQGKPFDHQTAKDLSTKDQIVAMLLNRKANVTTCCWNKRSRGFSSRNHCLR